MRPFTITFYSYKGGVGRTLLAANIGVLRAKRGKTLIWDLDIEAPGLHRINDLKPQSRIDSGLFEWIHQWQQSGKGECDYASLIDCIKPTRVSEQLHILSAHGDDADPAKLYQAIDWHDFLHLNIDDGYRLFAGALQAFGEAGYKTILLDARTGLTDLGGLIAALLPHVTVMVGNYGAQNVAGLAHIWKTLQPLADQQHPVRGNLPPLERLLVASPVPIEFKAREAAEQIWREAFGIDTKERLKTVAYDEDVLFSDSLMTALHSSERRIVSDYLEIDRALESYYQANLAATREIVRSEAARPDSFNPKDRGSPQQRGKTFEEKVAHLLQLLGYSVEQKQLLDGNEIDLIASKRGDFGEQTTYLVECKAYTGAVPKVAAEKLAVWIGCDQARQRRAKGMLVAEKEFSAATASFCESRSDLVALTYSQLERSLLDLTPYLSRLRQIYESKTQARWYVPQKVRLADQPEGPPVDLISHARAWARGAGSRLWLLLGDYGTGKSAFCEQLAYTLANDCANDADAPIPIAVNLRSFPNAVSLEQLLQEHLRQELQLAVNPAILLHLLAAGRIVLLLDSFDEMGVATVGQSIEEQFRQLAAPTVQDGYSPQANRVLITSRTHLFRDQSQAKKAGLDTLDANPESPLGLAARSFQATLDELQAFDPEQIATYLGKRLGPSAGQQAWADIQQIYGLDELAKVPQLLDIILQALPTLKAGGKAATPGALYLIYTDQWLNDPRLRLSEMQLKPAQVTLLLETLSTALWARADKRLHYSDLARLVREHSPTLAGGMNHERVDLELRTAAFLVRSTDGYYRFSHKSFLEFFIARRLWQINNHSGSQEELTSALDTARLNPETVSMLGDLLQANFSGDDSDSCYQTILAATAKLLAQPYRKQISENALLLRYYLLRHGNNLEEGWLSPAQLQSADLSGLSLGSINLQGAQLQQANFRGSTLVFANLSEANLQAACLDNANLAYANLQAAQLEQASFIDVHAYHASLSQAAATNSCWICADLRATLIDGTDFSASDLRATRLADSRGQSHWDQTNLLGATAPHTEDVQLPQLPNASLSPWLKLSYVESIASAAISADGHRLLSGYDFECIFRLWDAATGQEIRTFIGHQGPVTSVAFSPDGRHVLSGSYDATLRLWDASSGQKIHTFTGHQGPVTSVAFSPDGRHVLSGSYDATLRLWDATSGQKTRTFTGHQDSVTSVAFSPDGRHVLSGSYDHTLRLWDAASGQEIRSLAGHQGGVSSVAFSPDGRHILSGSYNATLRLWDATSGQEIRSLAGHKGGVSSVAFSPDSRRLLSGSNDHTLRLWDAASGQEIRSLAGHKGGVSSVAFSPDGRHLLSGSNDATLRLWDATSGQEIRSFAGHLNWVGSVAISADSSQLLSGGHDNLLRLWNATSGQEIYAFAGHQNDVRSVAFSADGRYLLSGSDDTTLRLWDAASGQEIRSLAGHQGGVTSVAFSPDGHFLLSGSDDATIRLWDAASGQELCALTAHASVNSIAFSADGSYFLSGSDDHTLRLWDAASGQEIRTFTGHLNWVGSVAISADSSQLLSGGNDATLRLWDAASGLEICTFDGHQDRVSSVAFSPDGRHLLSGSHDATLRLWDAASGQEVHTFTGHQGPVTSVAFSPDGRHVLSGSYDNTLRLWNAETGQEICRSWASGEQWFSLDMRAFQPAACLTDLPGPVLRGSGPVPLAFYDAAEAMQPAPWIPRRWWADDLPELWFPEDEEQGAS